MDQIYDFVNVDNNDVDVWSYKDSVLNVHKEADLVRIFGEASDISFNYETTASLSDEESTNVTKAKTSKSRTDNYKQKNIRDSEIRQIFDDEMDFEMDDDFSESLSVEDEISVQVTHITMENDDTNNQSQGHISEVSKSYAGISDTSIGSIPIQDSTISSEQDRSEVTRKSQERSRSLSKSVRASPESHMESNETIHPTPTSSSTISTKKTRQSDVSNSDDGFDRDSLGGEVFLSPNSRRSSIRSVRDGAKGRIGNENMSVAYSHDRDDTVIFTVDKTPTSSQSSSRRSVRRNSKSTASINDDVNMSNISDISKLVESTYQFEEDASNDSIAYDDNDDANLASEMKSSRRSSLTSNKRTSLSSNKRRVSFGSTVQHDQNASSESIAKNHHNDIHTSTPLTIKGSSRNSPQSNGDFISDGINDPSPMMSSTPRNNSHSNSNSKLKPSSEKKRKSLSKLIDDSDEIIENEVDESFVTISTPGSNDYTRGYVLPDESYIDEMNQDDDLKDSDDEGDTTHDDSGFTNTSYMSALRKRLKNKRLNKRSRVNGDHDDDDEDDDDDEEEATEDEQDLEDDDKPMVRRSKRATKGQRFDFWKGERPIYQHGMIIGVLKADPTPNKPMRKRMKRTKSMGHKSKPIQLKLNLKTNDKIVNAVEEMDEDIMDRTQGITLPTNVKYINREDNGAEEISIWDEMARNVNTSRVVCFKESLDPPTRLPASSKRKDDDKVGLAAQYFNTTSTNSGIVSSGFIAGFVDLPPGSIKDEETVGECAQVFFIGDCQDGAIEVAYADPTVDYWEDKTAQRQLLRKGDSFYVPPGNIYRLENHSTLKSCTLYWVIIKPVTTSNDNDELDDTNEDINKVSSVV